MFFQRACILNKIPKNHVKASKHWMLGPQDFILQHPLEPEADPEGRAVSENTNNVFQRAFMLNTTPKIHV